MSSSNSPRSDVEQSRTRKRRRIERACDRCKAKKTKCDAKQPSCSRCDNLEADCVYGEVVKRGKGKTKAHVQSLEERLVKMEALLVANASSSHETRHAESTIDLSGPTPSSCANPNIDSDSNFKVSPTGNENRVLSALHAEDLITESSTRHTGNTESLLLRLPASLPGANITQNYVDRLRGNNVQRLSRMQTLVPMPPTVEIFTIVEIYLDDVNVFLPIFHPQTLRLLCQRGAMSERPDSLWWACMNVIIATTTQSRSTDDGFSKVSAFSWGFFKNAFSVYDDIVTSEPTVLGLQVLLAMVVFVGRTADLRLALLLSSSCVHMAQVLGLGKQIETVEVSHEEAVQRNRLIWITFTLDTLIRIKAGQPLILSPDSITIGLPENSTVDRFGCYQIPGTDRDVNLLSLMVQITVIRTRVYSHAMASTPEILSSPTTQEFIASMHSRISAWTEELPIDYRPGGTTMVLDFPMLVLHLAYYDCMDLVCTLIKQSNVPEGPASTNATGMLFSMDLKEQKFHSSRSVLDLRRSCNAIPFVYLWNPLQDMLAAVLELTSNVLVSPDSEHALANVKAISSFVRFLEDLKYNKGCDVTRLLDGCIVLENSVKRAVLGDQGAHVDAVKLLLTCSPGHKTLAQALMTNLPRLDSVCEAAAINVFIQSGQGMSSCPLLAPDCIMPSTYNFGPDPTEISVVDTTRAVYINSEV